MHAAVTRLTLVTVVIAGLVLATACGQSGPPSGDGPGGEKPQFQSEVGTSSTLTVHLGATPQTLDPNVMQGAVEGRVAYQMYEGLFMPPNGNGPAVPAAASGIEISDDGTIFTISIRDDAVWSNGDPLTADDFAFSWMRALHPETASTYSSFLYDIVNAEAYNKGEITDFSQVGVEVVDPKTIRITLNAAVPFFTEKLAFYTYFPVHKDSVMTSEMNEEGYWDETDASYWRSPENLVTNGPYTLKSYNGQTSIVLEKNARYHSADGVSIPQIQFRIIKEASAAVNSFESGGLDVNFGSIPLARIPQLRQYKEYIEHPALIVYYYRINTTTNEFLANQKVRNALSMAINRADFVERQLNGDGIPADGFVPPIDGYTRNETLAEYDPQAALEMMREAGYGNGDGLTAPPALELLYNTDENHKAIAEYLAGRWKQLFDLDVSLINTEWQDYIDRTNEMDYQVVRAGWIGDYEDPETFLHMWRTGDGHNNTGWSNAEYDRIMAQSAITQDRAERMRLYAQAEDILLREMPIIPIYFYVNNPLVSTRIRGFEPNVRDLYLFKHWSLANAE